MTIMAGTTEMNKRERFTPESPDWDRGIRLDACPIWCDGDHGSIANYADTPQGAVGDAIHTNPFHGVKHGFDGLDDTVLVGICQHPDEQGDPGSPYLEIDSIQITPDSALRLADEIVDLVKVAVPGYKPCPHWCISRDPLHDWHDAEEGGRVHYAASSKRLGMTMDDETQNWDIDLEFRPVKLRPIQLAWEIDSLVADLQYASAFLREVAVA